MWIDQRGAGVRYAAAANIRASQGDKGTLAIWQYTPYQTYHYASYYWELYVDAGNYMRSAGRSLMCKSGSVNQNIEITNLTQEPEGHGLKWEHLVYTWDFSTPNAGELRLYWDGESVGTPINDANAPVGTPAHLSLGGAYIETGSQYRDTFLIDSVAVWDDVMTPEQVAELNAEGHRGRIGEADGTGNLTLLASFDGQYDANVAAGDGTLQVVGTADRYCLLDDGAREQGRRRFLIGTPRHDHSEDDRVPFCVPCPLRLNEGQRAYVSMTNEASHGVLEITPGYTSNYFLGTSICRYPIQDNVEAFLSGPHTFRQRIHVLNHENPTGRAIRIGPVDYVHADTEAIDVYDQYSSGRGFSVVDDPGNSSTQFKTDFDDRFGADYWNGADVTFLTGNCAGRRLKATDYDDVTQVVTIEGALPATPEVGSFGVIDHRARLQGCTSGGSANDHGKPRPEDNIDAWLWEFHSDGSKLFTELEFAFVQANSDADVAPNFLRYDRGRTVKMDGASNAIYSHGAGYGKPRNWNGEAETFFCKLMVERIEIDGPTCYQRLRREADGSGPEYADNFMLRAPSTDQGTKVWRWRNVERQQERPTKIPDPSLVYEDLREEGTWRDTPLCPPCRADHDADGSVICFIVAEGADGIARLGYIKGHWDDATGRIVWEDEIPPAGKENPFLVLSELRADRASDAPFDDTVEVHTIVEAADGTWCLSYTCHSSQPDHYYAMLWCGSEDRWSFDREKHWWHGNPLCQVIGGPDRLAPEASGFGQWMNRDAGWVLAENPYTNDSTRRYLAYARGKTISHRGDNNAADIRPVVGLQGADPRSMRPLPHGNTVSPLAGPLVHGADCAAIGQGDCLTLYTDTSSTSGAACYVSEDGIHWQHYADQANWIPQGELPGEGIKTISWHPFTLGDKQVYPYQGISAISYAWCRLGGECWYALSDGQTQGFLETPLIEKPAEGWASLVLNSDPAEGEIAVAVLDGDTEEELAGFSAADFDTATDSVEHGCRWNGAALGTVDAETIRLRFVLSREAPEGESPKVFAWQISEEDVSPPHAYDPRVEGFVNPTDVNDPTPEFSWEYEDPEGLAQTAYQVIVASTQEALDSGVGDIWDTGQVAGAETSVTYAGGTLASNTVYYWKVRVRNSQGVWSEQW